MMIVSPSWLYHCWVAAQCIHVFTRMHLCLARCELHLLPLRRLECEMRTVNCTCCLHRWLLAAPAESKHPIKAPDQSTRSKHPSTHFDSSAVNAPYPSAITLCAPFPRSCAVFQLPSCLCPCPNPSPPPTLFCDVAAATPRL